MEEEPIEMQEAKPKVSGEQVTLEERKERGHVLARLIIDMLGAPKEHIESTLKMYIDKLQENDKFTFQSIKFAPAEPQDKLFSAFAEIEVWFPKVADLIGFCFDSLPSSVEILEPARFNMQASELAGLLNDLQAKIHKIDMDLKNTKAENMILNNQALKLIHYSIHKEVRESPKTFDQLKGIGELKDNVLKDILDRMTQAKELVLEGNIYKPA